jgi:hypothetical protein
MRYREEFTVPTSGGGVTGREYHGPFGKKRF